MVFKKKYLSLFLILVAVIIVLYVIGGFVIVHGTIATTSSSSIGLKPFQLTAFIIDGSGTPKDYATSRLRSNKFCFILWRPFYKNYFFSGFEFQFKEKNSERIYIDITFNETCEILPSDGSQLPIPIQPYSLIQSFDLKTSESKTSFEDLYPPPNNFK